MSFNLNDYEPVADRIEKFWKDHPAGKILTDIVEQDERRFIVKAWIWRGPITQPIVLPEGAQLVQVPIDQASPDATGYAEEIVGSGNVNRTSALENCETSAIGRALANLGYASKAQRASREEMAKVGREQAGVKLIHVAKGRLLSAVGGDTDKARELWTKAEATLGIPPEQEPADPELIDAVLTAALALRNDA